MINILKRQISFRLLHITAYSNVIDTVLTLDRMHDVVGTIKWFRLTFFNKKIPSMQVGTSQSL